jgi:mono/diheme cytochrome c family protein
MKLLWILFPFLLWGQEAFISYYDYGEMLYQNPRGISCMQCHGAKGEGKIILEYKDSKGNIQTLKGVDIRQKPLKSMVLAMNRYHKVMPRYYLTEKEVKAIYDYLEVKNKEE